MDVMELQIVALGEAYLRLRSFQERQHLDNDPDNVTIGFVGDLIAKFSQAARIASDELLVAYGPDSAGYGALAEFVLAKNVSPNLDAQHSERVLEVEKEILAVHGGVLNRSTLLRILERLYQSGRDDEKVVPLNSAMAQRQQSKAQSGLYRGRTQEAASNPNFRPCGCVNCRAARDADGYENGN